MEKTQFCKHCQQQFVQKRSNHLYCSASCRTKASYERNNYRYVSGHYEKPETAVTNKLALPANQDVLSAVQALEDKIEGLKHSKNISSTSIKEAALGTMAADAGAYAAKRIFAPNSLPATKGDIQSLKEEIQQLKNTLILNKLNKYPNNF